MDKSKNSKKKPFKWTRELIRLALNDGWTQQDIAEKCRTQQSIVSAWKKGSKQGTEQQLLPLLNIYGHKIRRNSFKVYWSLNTDTMEKSFYRVEGKVILSKVFYRGERLSRNEFKRSPKLKIVIHHQGADQFRVVIQSRRAFQKLDDNLAYSIENAFWNSEVLEPVTVTQLIEFIDRCTDELLTECKVQLDDAITLPFLIIQSLLNHGFPVPSIAEYPAVW